MEKRKISFFFVLKPFVRPFCVAFSVYTLAMFSIWRAGISFIDDMGRAINGLDWSSSFNRYSQSWLSYFLNANFHISDISPITQIVAMIFLSISSIILTYVFCNEKIKYLPLILSTFIGLNMYAAECWLYKFDSPGIALAILASVLPILFWSKIRKNTYSWISWIGIAFFSLLCFMVVWTSYQPTTGFFPVILLGLIVKDIIDKKKSFLILVKSIFLSSIYLLSAIFFKYLLPAPSGYREVAMIDIFDQPINTLFFHVKTYFTVFVSGLNNEWKILIILFLIAFLISLIAFSQRHRMGRAIDLFAGVILVLVGFPLSYGALIFLEQPAFDSARFMMGVGAFFAVVALLLSHNISKYSHMILVVPATILLYSFIVFHWALGNGLLDQYRWGSFRNEILLSDLSVLYPSKNIVSKTTMQVQGRIGPSAVMSHVAKKYPVAYSIVTPQQDGLSWLAFGTYPLRNYYNRPQNFIDPWSENWDCTNMNVVKDTYYHSIRADDTGRVCVLLK